MGLFNVRQSWINEGLDLAGHKVSEVRVHSKVRDRVYRYLRKVYASIRDERCSIVE